MTVPHPLAQLAAKPKHAARSLRRTLLVGILVPVLGFVVLNSVGLYRQALAAADTAYDRTLLASAKAIGELLEVQGPAPGSLRGNLVYSALEAFEADNRSRIYYRVTGFSGELVSGFAELPLPRAQDSGGATDNPNLYAALVRFYDDQFDGQPVRMAVLLQPVAGAAGQGMATVQVAETLEVRRTLARNLLVQTLWQHALLLAVIAAVVVWVVQRATQPVRGLSQTLAGRAENDLSPLAPGNTPHELLPVVDATNSFMARMAHLVAHQKRLVRDASHQLRTPLAVLKTQVQSARRGDVGAQQALAEIAETVDRATELANQLLALARVEQLRHQEPDQLELPALDWGDITRAVALDVAPLMADAGLDFDIYTTPTPVRAHVWALRELTRNLLHNAIRHSPAGAPLSVAVVAVGEDAVLTVIDCGPGINAQQRERLFQPFSADDGSGTGLSTTGSSSGLGLAISAGIVQSLNGRISLDNRPAQNSQAKDRPAGLTATVHLPLSAKEAA
jgi:two-component system, OmpR family, sensor histidine kinase TctE